MNFITINQYGKVIGSAGCPDEVFPLITPQPGCTNIPDLGPLDLSKTIWRLVDGQLVDTHQPLVPPHSWMTWSDETCQWVDARDLAALKDAKWVEIKAARATAEYGGFTWDGSTFDSDLASQQKIMGAAQLAGLNSAYEVDWTLADNSVRHLNASQMTAVGTALGDHVNAQYVHARTLRQQIADAQTSEAVSSITW